MNQTDTSLHELRDRITVSGYQVDPVAVADAIVRRRWSVAIAPQAGLRPSSAPRRRARAHVHCIARNRSASRIRPLAA
jgi:hypothetical protein